MRQLNKVVIDKVAPNDPEILWINVTDNTINVCENGVWLNLLAELNAKTDEMIDNIGTLDTRTEGIADAVDSMSDDIGDLADRVGAIEISLNPSNTGK